MKISPKAFVSGEKVKKSSFKGFLDTTRDLRLYLQDPGSFQVRHDFRKPECFITEDGDLGPYIRWALLAELLWERWKDDPLRPKTKIADSKATPSFVAWLHGQAEDYLQRLAHARQKRPSSPPKGASKRRGLTAPVEGGVLDQHQANAKDFALYFAHRHGTRRPASAYQVEEAIFRTMLSKLKTLYPHRRSELLHSDVLRIPAMASHHPSSGPDRFKAWLRTGILPPADDLSSLRAEYLVPDNKGLRRKQLSDVIARIQNGPPTHPFINIHAESAATGLTAMATSILVELMQLRQKGSDTLPHGFIYVNLARRENGVEAPTRESVLRAFEKAFKISDRRGKRTVHRPIDLYADLLAVRQALTVHPTLVVVDGLVNDGSDLSPVFSLLRNTQWDEFLRILAMPVGIGSTLGEVHKSRSRFVVLSSLRVASLSAWTDYCKRLEPLNDLDAIGSLFEQPGPFVGKLREQCAALGVATRDFSELITRYQLKEPFSTYFGIGRKGLLPAECDLALASLLEVGDMALVQANHDLEKVKLGRRRQIVFEFWLSREVRRHPLAVLALKMIATSINGLRLETLHRSLLCLHELIDWTKNDIGSGLHIKGLKSYMWMPPSRQLETLAQLAAQYPSILVSGPDETLEVLDVNDRWAEVKVNHSLNEPTVNSDRMHIDFVHEEVRALFVGAMTAAPSSTTSSCGGEWEHINLVFAEEALRQATAQLRHLHHRDLQNLYGHRRVVQTILHGLMSFRVEEPHDPAATSPQRLPYFALPIEPRRRLQFLYVFLYRFCLEDAPQWLLARAFGRPDLKLSLLLMFADPSRLRDMLGHAVHSHTTSSDDNYTGLVAKVGERIAPIWDQTPGTPALRKDVLRAIGRAAYEVGLFPLVKRVIEESQTTEPEKVESFRLNRPGFPRHP